jgi:DNA polymerase-1
MNGMQKCDLPGLEAFDEVWCVDTEYSAPPGCRPTPVCLVAKEALSGREVRLWQDDLFAMSSPPFRIDERALFVAYAASAEFGVFQVLGWPAPSRVLDLFFEFRARINGFKPPSGDSLLGALVCHGLPAMDGIEKQSMRELAIRGGPFTADERQALLDYCAGDVDPLLRLLPRMLPRIDVPRALLRGRYAWAVASMEHHGIPIDVPMFDHLRSRWKDIQTALVTDLDAPYGVFDGLSFSTAKFSDWLITNDIPWPRLESGNLDLKDETFKDMAGIYPAIGQLRSLRKSLGKMRLFDEFAIGPDGRNRAALMPFRASTGRNQPSNARYIFGAAKWVRGLIKPEQGMALAYIDYSQQEFGIAAALSGDEAMADAYRSADPYLTFAKQAGDVPPEATKETHPEKRAMFKACVLAVQFGMGAVSLSFRIGKSVDIAKKLLRLHRDTYPTFWRWSEAAVDRAVLLGRLETVFGWPVHIGPSADPMKGPNARSIANFPCQAHGAEMLRLACCMLVEQGVRVCAPVHDAVLIEGPADEIDAEVERARKIMAEASRIVLGGFEIGTDVVTVRYPERYMDPEGQAFWDTVIKFAGPLPASATQPKEFGSAATQVRQSGQPVLI